MAREMKRRMEREPCNFCEFSRAGYGCGSQDNDAELRREVEKLRSLIKRISGKDDTLTFTEMVSVENHLKDVRRILDDQKKKVELEEDERLRNQNKEAEDTSRSQVVHKNNAPLLKIRRHFEIRNAESLQTEFDRLWLLNERMNGRELDGMNSFDLTLLDTEISRAMMAFINQKSYPMMEQMARQKSKDVENKEPIKIVGTLRLLCDFCGFFSNNRYEQSPHSQEESPEAMLPMESQFKRLKLSTRRMTCQDLDGLSFNELLLLETHLNAVWLIVQDQKKKIKEEEDQKNEDDGLGTTRQVFSGSSSSSSGERQEQQHGDAPLPVMSRDQIEFERQSAASLEIKFEKLWLLKERMNGRELEGMNSAELQVLEDRIIQALEDLGEHRLAPTLDRLAKKHREENDVVAVEPERCSLGQRQG